MHTATFWASVRFFIVGIILFLIVFPLTWLIAGSFAPEEGHFFSAYTEIFLHTNVYSPLLNTIIIASLATIASVLFSVPLAWLNTRTDMPFRNIFGMIALVPFITTPFVGALAWTVLAAPRTGILNTIVEAVFGVKELLNIYSLGGVIFVLALYTSPYIYIMTTSSLRSIDPALEESSEMMGAKPWYTSLRIILPLVAPGILAGALLSFVNASENFGIPAVLGRPADVYMLTTTIYRLINEFPPSYDKAAVVSLLLLFITAIAITFQRYVLGKKQYVTITGKGFRQKIIQLGKWRYVTAFIFAIYLLAAVVLPYLALLLSSFLPSGIFDLNFFRLTFENYFYVWGEYPISINGFKNSLLLSGLGATITIALVSVAAYVAIRGKKWGHLLEFLIMAPIAVPGIVLAVGLLWAYIHPPLILYGTIWILLVAYITRFIPFGERAAASSMLQVDKSLEESSEVCGGSWFYTFRKIILPMIRPGLAAGWTLLFVAMMRELGSSILLYSYDAEVISVALYDMWEGGEFGSLSAYAFSTSFITLGILYLFQKIFNVDITKRI